MHRKNKVNEIWALQNGELVEIDDEPIEGITVSADDFGGNIRDVVDIYLHWNGVIGYTDRIYGIWEDTGSIDKVKAYCDYEGIGDLYDLDDALRGEVYIRDMDQDDFAKLKRQLGIYESVRKPMRRRLKENEIRRYSDAVPYEKRRYWYWTKHGLGPGTLPKGVNVLDAKEGQNQKGTWGVFVLLDAVLNSSELREYDLIELAPKEVNESKKLCEDDDYEEDTPRCKRVERFLDRIDIFDLGFPLVRERDGVVEVEFPDVEVTEDAINKIKRNAKEILGIDVDTDADGDYFTFYFELTESRKSKNKKLTEGKLVEPPIEDIEFFENYITDTLGYDIEAKGKTWMGRNHYQIRSIDRGHDREDLKLFARDLIQLDELMEKREIPMTYSAGLDDNGYITAGLDLDKKYIPDETDVPLEQSHRYTKLFVDNTDESLKESVHTEILYTVVDNDGNPLNDFSDEKEAIDFAMTNAGSAAVDIYEWQYDEDGELIDGNRIGTAWEIENESLRESRQLNEGPGAGYSIKGSLSDIVVNDFKIIQQYQIDDAFPNDPDYTVFEIGCDIDGVLEVVEVSSYYYGGMISTVPVKITHMEVFANGVPEEPTEEDIEYLLSSDFEIDCKLGGGWSHSNFDGELLINHPSEWNYNSNIDLKDINIKFEDPQAVDAVNKYATGDNYTPEYRTDDGEYFETKEDAIEYAEENDCDFVEEVREFWSYDGENYDYEDMDLVGKVWVNPKTEGAYDGEVL